MEAAMRSSRQKREQAKRFKRLTEAQAALGWGVILLLSALLGVIYLSQASGIAAVGRRVQNLQVESEMLKRENGNLERQIAEAQSLERLQQEALRLGFVQAQASEIDYIVIPDYPVASDTDEPTEAPVVTVPPAETIGEVLWLSLKNSVSHMIYGEAGEQ
jgi:cell division protein FtsL